MREPHRIVVGSLRANCYVVAHESGDAVIVDPGDDAEAIAAHVDDRRLRVRAILATHAHDDHVGAVAPLVEEYGAPFHLHADDRALLLRANLYRNLVRDEPAIRVPDVDVALEADQGLRFAAVDVKVLHTPGHTAGSVCFEIGGELFTGDTITATGLGRTDLPGGCRERREESIAMLAQRYPATVLLRPGHGDAVPLGDALPPAASDQALPA